MNLNEQATQPTDLEYRTIPLTKGKFAVVDGADFDWLSQWKWTSQVTPGGAVYAIRYSKGGRLHRKRIAMARQIMGEPIGFLVDHINRDTLDNRRRNLRSATKQQNAWNRRTRNVSSGLKGVQRSGSGWSALICVDKKMVYLGQFKDKFDAKARYDEEARKIHGQFFCP